MQPRLTTHISAARSWIIGKSMLFWSRGIFRGDGIAGREIISPQIVLRVLGVGWGDSPAQRSNVLQRRKLRRPRAVEHGAAHGNVFELDAGARLPQQQTAAAHV